MLPLKTEARDFYLIAALRANAAITSLALLLIFSFIAWESISALSSSGLGLLLDKAWYPLEGQFTIWPMLAATLISSVGALFIALPFGLFVAVFALFYAPSFFRSPFVRIVELYASLPSVIFGFWGLLHIVPLINNWHPPGQSLLAGILILALMIFPILALNLMAGLREQSSRYEYLSASLGLRHSTFLWSVLIPANYRIICSSSILALGRALGETMAVLMVCGNIVRMPSSIFDPVRTLTANIALEMSYAMEIHRSALFATGLVLLCLVSLLVYAAQYLQNKWDMADSK